MRRSLALWETAIPDELTALTQWVLWRYELIEGGKFTKVLYRIDGRRKASSSDPRTWSSFEDALEALDAQPDMDGAGFVFTADDPYCGNRSG
jgi:primase-polymerase (primpol)-like protein